MQAVFAASDRPFPEMVHLVLIKALNGLLSDAPVPKELLNDPRCTIATDDRAGLGLFHRAAPLTVRRLHRGELSKPREEIAPAIPAVLRPDNFQRPLSGTANESGSAWDFAAVAPTERRAVLAKWLTSPDNPLTARVLVNRVWGWHFGQALVRTPNDFGKQGEPPTHPGLLDWLARDFMDHGWSLKRLHRQIMLSRTYQMLSAAPDDRLVAHYPRHRLEGEAIRDAMLACSGTLNLKSGGPPVVPPLGSQELTGLFDAKLKWPVTRDVSEHSRRSIYLLVRRTFAYPFFAAFDPPEVMTSCPQRARTVVPTQALTLLNSPVAREQAAAFACRLLHECGDKPDAIITRAWHLALGRSPNDAERRRALDFLKGRSDGVAALCLALFNANEFVFVD
jgi:hypothetical protein